MRRTEWTLAEMFRRSELSPQGCWLYTAAKPRPQGYVYLGVLGETIAAHRLAYKLRHGSVPADKQLDHVCHTIDANCAGGWTCPHRRCVNPDHLEPVTNQENTQRSVPAQRTTCPSNHPYQGRNLIVYRGRRYCRTCMDAHRRESAARKRMAVSA